MKNVALYCAENDSAVVCEMKSAKGISEVLNYLDKYLGNLFLKKISRTNIALGLLFTCISFSLFGCSATRDFANNSPINNEQAKINQDLPQDINTRNSMTKFVYDIELKKEMIEFANDLNGKIREANPSGINSIALREAYKNNDATEAMKVLGISSKDLTVMQQRFESLQNKIREKYPEVYDFAKRQAQSNLTNQEQRCVPCNPDEAFRDIQKINQALQASFTLKTKRFQGYSDIAYPSIDSKETNVNSNYGPLPTCTADDVIPLVLICSVRTAACLIGAAFTPPPFNIVLIYVCFLDWSLCNIKALKCEG